MTALTQRIVSEIEAAPEPVQAEVLDFVLFVKARVAIVSGPGSPARIQHTPGVCGGEACIGMTRITALRFGVRRDTLLEIPARKG